MPLARQERVEGVSRFGRDWSQSVAIWRTDGRDSVAIGRFRRVDWSVSARRLVTDTQDKAQTQKKARFPLGIGPRAIARRRALLTFG
mgnify:CR=1 FL=1